MGKWLHLLPAVVLAAGCTSASGGADANDCGQAGGDACGQTGSDDAGQTGGDDAGQAGASLTGGEDAGPTLVETEDLTSAALPSLAMNGAGTSLAMWLQRDGMNYEVWGNQHTLEAGWGTAQAIGGPKGGLGSGPQVAIDAAGNGLAVWDLRDGIDADAWMTRYTPGSGWGSAERLEDDHAGIASAPRLAMDASGHALVTWWASGAGFWAKRFDPSSGWAAAELIDSSDNWAGAHAAVNGVGDAVIVYALQAGSAATPLGTTLLGKRYEMATGWTEASVIATTVVDGVANGIAAPSFHSPQAALTPDGTALAVWLAMAHPGSGLMFARGSAEGEWSSLSGPPYPASQPSEGGQASRLFSSRNGDAIVGWTPQSFMNARGGVFSSRYHPDTGWEQVEVLQGNGSDAPRAPHIAGNTAGDFVAVWSRGDEVQNTMWLNRYEASSGWGTARSIASSGRHDPMPQTAIDEAGNALIIWVQGDDTHLDLVAQELPKE